MSADDTDTAGIGTEPSVELEPLGPDSLCWELAGDWRHLLMVGSGLLLQVAHPVVAAGVDQHSVFKTDPYGRFLRSFFPIVGVIYAGEQSKAEADRIRFIHKRIKGEDQNGKAYYSLDPDPFFWVHATIFQALVTMCQRFIRPLSESELERFYGEWRQLGRLYSFREREMPADLPAFRAYWQEALTTKTDSTPVVADVLHSLANPPAPPGLGWLPGPLWRALAYPSVKLMDLVTVGTLPPELRERWGLPWSDARERRLRLLATLIRAVMRLVPKRMRYMPVAAAGWRRIEHAPRGASNPAHTSSASPAA